MVTLTKVAAAAGVTLSTASRAIGDNPRISVKVRKRVRAVARQLGYVRNATVSAIMRDYRVSARTTYRETLAYLSFHDPAAWKQPDLYFYEEVLHGARARGNSLGYTLAPFWLNAPGVRLRRLADILEARGIRGVLLAPLPELTASLAFPWQRFSCVAVGFMLQAPLLHRSGRDLFRDMGALLEALVARGYQRIGFAADRAIENRLANLSEARFALFQQDLPADRRVPPCVVSPYSADEFLAWFERHRPEVVISEDHRPLDWLTARGWRVPADVGFACISTRRDRPGVAGIAPALEEIGACGLDLLAAAVQSGERGAPVQPHATLSYGRWLDGHTLLAKGRRKPPGPAQGLRKVATRAGR
jgi:DNA-binding LacI/PurR family transcriptional regulator